MPCKSRGINVAQNLTHEKRKQTERCEIHPSYISLFISTLRNFAHTHTHIGEEEERKLSLMRGRSAWDTLCVKRAYLIVYSWNATSQGVVSSILGQCSL